MLEPYVRPGIDDRPDLDKVLSPEDKAAVARLAIKNRRRPPEASADQPEAQAVRLLPPVLRQPLLQPPVWTLPRRICRPPTSHARSHGRRQWPTPYRRSGLPTQLGFLRCFNSGRRTLGALNTIAMPNAIARTFGYDTAVAGHIAINPATGRPLPVATELAMPLAVLVIVA
mgnify:CR=1 FL=1